MKKLLSCILVLSLVLSLSVMGVSAAYGPRDHVTDNAGILTENEKNILEAKAQIASESVDCGIYILTVEDYRDLPDNGKMYYYVESTLQSYYMDNGYGTGTGRDGIILMLSMADRDYALFTHGFGDEGLSDAAMDLIVAKFLDDFKDNLWYDGFEDFIENSQHQLQRSRDGHPLEGTYYPPRVRMVGFVLSFLIAVLIADLIQMHFVKQLKSVAPQTLASQFLVKGSGEITTREDRYTHTSTSRIYDPPSSSGSGRSGSSGSSSRGSSSGCSRSGKF